jgi:hypothetical protein
MSRRGMLPVLQNRCARKNDKRITLFLSNSVSQKCYLHFDIAQFKNAPHHSALQATRRVPPHHSDTVAHRNSDYISFCLYWQATGSQARWSTDLFVCLFMVVSSADYTARNYMTTSEYSNGRNQESRRGFTEVIQRNWPGGTDENYQKS